jgi:hypothetical protein
MTRVLNDNRLSSEWSEIRQNLRVIADAYGLSWADFEDGYYRQDSPDTRGHNDDYRRRNRNTPWWGRDPF